MPSIQKLKIGKDLAATCSRFSLCVFMTIVHSIVLLCVFGPIFLFLLQFSVGTNGA